MPGFDLAGHDTSCAEPYGYCVWRFSPVGVGRFVPWRQILLGRSRHEEEKNPARLRLGWISSCCTTTALVNTRLSQIRAFMLNDTSIHSSLEGKLEPFTR